MTDEAEIYRQGDVWIYRITQKEYLQRISHSHLPVGADPNKGLILAEGEATGHHHRIAETTRVNMRISRDNGLVRLLEVNRREDAAPVSLVHEEHETITIPPGFYEVRIQREYSPTERSKQSYVRD